MAATAQTETPALTEDDSDAAELIGELQGAIRSLEQKELSQMRQNSILQRKLDEVEQTRRELEQDREQRLQQKQETQKSTSASRAVEAREAFQTLEKELQDKLESVLMREKELAETLRKEQARKREAEDEADYWKRCGQELLRREQETGSQSALAAVQASKSETLQKEALELATETEALRCRIEELNAQLEELSREAATAKAQETELMMRSACLERTISQAESAAAASREKLLRHKEDEQRLQQQASSTLPTLDRSNLHPEEIEEGRGQEAEAEVEYMRRRVEERSTEMESLEREHQRLRTALHRHKGPANGPSKSELSDSLSSRGCGPFDEMISWFAMTLFKSSLIRRAFCVHLAVLYSWILFLLWWISERPHQ